MGKVGGAVIGLIGVTIVGAGLYYLYTQGYFDKRTPQTTNVSITTPSATPSTNQYYYYTSNEGDKYTNSSYGGILDPNKTDTSGVMKVSTSTGTLTTGNKVYDSIGGVQTIVGSPENSIGQTDGTMADALRVIGQNRDKLSVSGSKNNTSLPSKTSGSSSKSSDSSSSKVVAVSTSGNSTTYSNGIVITKNSDTTTPKAGSSTSSVATKTASTNTANTGGVKNSISSYIFGK